MKKLCVLLLVIVAGCCDPVALPDRAELIDGWWHVTLSNGTQCIARPWDAPERDESAEAIAECRATQ